MNFLLDTNVVSEWAKPKPDQGIVAWLAATPEDATYLSVVTLTELRYGIALLAESKRKRDLNSWLETALPRRFHDRLLQVTPEIADRCGVLQAASRRRGRSLHAMDGFIAATAAVQGMTLVTRNTRDFTALELKIVNPWIV